MVKVRDNAHITLRIASTVKTVSARLDVNPERPCKRRTSVIPWLHLLRCLHKAGNP